MVEIVSDSWLEERLSDSGQVIVDPRPVVKYLEGHIPNAVNLSLARLLDPGSLALIPVGQLSLTIGAAGIDHDSTVVVYDAYDGQNGAMLAWVLEYLGHRKTSLLSSRLEGWTHEGREILYKPVKPIPKQFDAKPRNEVRAGREEVLQKSKAKLLDLRSRDEFRGHVATEARTGHIPGAVNLPWTDLIGNGHEFLRSKAELDEAGRRAGLGPTDDIMTYCSHGPRAAVGYVALRLLGYNVRVYDGSFHEWAQHSELPVEGEGLQIQF